MFSYCQKLADIKALENWKVTNCLDFKEMFEGCNELENIEPLKN